MEECKVRVWDLESRTVTTGFLPEADYFDYSMNEEGILTAYSKVRGHIEAVEAAVVPEPH